MLRPKWIAISLKRFINSQNVRLRFAPSPTGFIHLGGLRTTFYNYLFARKHNGKFILRIEDTDRDRVVPGALDAIIDVLRWSNLEPDEGPKYGGNYGPYIQSERKPLYNEMIEKLLKTDSVYRCFCTTKRLELLRREALKNRETPRYDNRCRSLSEDEIRKNIANNVPFTVRLKLKSGPIKINDMVYGKVTYDLSRIEGDPILIKSDGLPTYHFANVVDDYHMAITHVLRGVEWLISTPKHLMLYDAFGWPKPKFAHLPLLVNKNGSKLSKRNDDIQIEKYRQQGYYPEVIINYLTQMGGGFGYQLNTVNCDKIYSINELIDAFNLESVNQNNCKIDPDKCRLLNRLFINQLIQNDSNRIRLDLLNLLKKNQHKFQNQLQFNNDNEYLDNILQWCSNRITSINDLLTDEFLFLWSQPKQTWTIDEEFKSMTKQQIIQILNETIIMLKKFNDDDFKNDKILIQLRQFNNDNNDQQIKFNAYMKLLRLSLTNLKKGPPVAEAMSLLGKDRTIQYIKNSIQYLNDHKS